MSKMGRLFMTYQEKAEEAVIKHESYKVIWEQWFRYGPDGDESDFNEKVVVFATLAEAEQFKAELVAGKDRGVFDRTVHAHEVTIKKEESNQ